MNNKQFFISNLIEAKVTNLLNERKRNWMSTTGNRDSTGNRPHERRTTSVGRVLKRSEQFGKDNPKAKETTAGLKAVRRRFDSGRGGSGGVVGRDGQGREDVARLSAHVERRGKRKVRGAVAEANLGEAYRELAKDYILEAMRFPKTATGEKSKIPVLKGKGAEGPWKPHPKSKPYDPKRRTKAMSKWDVPKEK